MKTLLMIFALALIVSPASAQLVITGVFDGPLSGGQPKGVELYACSDIDDLSIYGLGSANNGGGTDGVECFLPAVSVAAGTFYYVSDVDSGNPTAFFDWFGFDFDFEAPGYSMSINGDDAIELFYVGADQLGLEVVDIHGDINVDGSGTAWESLDGWAKRVTSTGPDGTTFVLSSWTFSGPNAWDGELTNDTALVPFPLGGFECNPAVSIEETSWDAMKALYR
jgi:hypothetical protein